MIKLGSKWLITICLILIVITLSGCGSTPEQEGAISFTNNTPVPTDSPADTPLPLTPFVTIDMILIPAGEFEMGQDADQSFASCQILFEPYKEFMKCNLSWFEDEEPVHTIHLDDYYIDKYEVTTADYQVCVQAGVCDQPEKTSSKTHDEYYGNPEYADYPVIYVNWFDANTFCEWRGARLPTEAEWEKAARGTDGRIYPWGDNFDEGLGNFCIPGENKYSDTAPVGSYPDDASPYGVMDMAGNVFEWVADWFKYDYFSNSPSENPQGPSDGTHRVMKSCNWSCDYTPSIRASDRFWRFPDYGEYNYGFRCATSSP